ANKVWNAFRLVKGWEVDESLSGAENEIAVKWFSNRFYQALDELEGHFEKYRISDALMTVYKLIWDDFCSWYLEMIKPAYQRPIDKTTYNATVGFFENLMKILHPFMPFITEEIWHNIRDRVEDDCIIVAEWPRKAGYDERIIAATSNIFEAIGAVRNLRAEKQISPRDPLSLKIKTASR